jgi:flagellar hook-length control protein FliK
VNNSSLNLFGLTTDRNTIGESKSIKNQTLTKGEGAVDFKSLLAPSSDAALSAAVTAGVNKLPLEGKVLPSQLLEQLPELAQLSDEQLQLLAEQLGVALDPKALQMAAQIGDIEAKSAISKIAQAIQGATGLQPATQIAASFTAVAEEGVETPVIPTKPISDQQLIATAQTFGASVKVAERVISAPTVNGQPLVDEDLLLQAQEGADAHLARAKAAIESSAQVTRSDANALLQQMQGRVRVNPNSSDMSLAGKTIKADGTISNNITTDNFLVNRAFNLSTNKAPVMRSVQSELMQPTRVDMPESISTATTSARFLEQRFMAQQASSGSSTSTSVQPNTPTLLPGVVQLTPMDTSQHATAQAQRLVADQQPLENFVTVQNQDRMQRAMGERIMQMVESGKWDAEMELNPSRLGTVRIRMNMENSELQLVVTSQNSAVREMLEAGLPRLRDGLQEQGIMLANSSVQQEGGSHQGGSNFAQNGQNSGAFSANQEGIASSDNAQSITSGPSHDGELDTFA